MGVLALRQSVCGRLKQFSEAPPLGGFLGGLTHMFEGLVVRYAAAVGGGTF